MKNTETSVDISSSTSPWPGQVLMAENFTSAKWKDPSPAEYLGAGGDEIESWKVRLNAGMYPSELSVLTYTGNYGGWRAPPPQNQVFESTIMTNKYNSGRMVLAKIPIVYMTTFLRATILAMDYDNKRSAVYTYSLAFSCYDDVIKRIGSLDTKSYVDDSFDGEITLSFEIGDMEVTFFVDPGQIKDNIIWMCRASIMDTR